ncbi:DoxX family protein [Kribbella sp. CA-253562]|uniref:DoxX family protein n=1 Tax=Kribbella sp. CA-253562 TaxID=3239942 RepID=UPI003D8FFEB6
MLFRILFVVLCVGFIVGGVGSLLGVPFFQEIMDRVGVGRTLAVAISVLEIAAAVALVIGLFVPVVGVTAAAGLFLLMIGAVLFHARAKDFKGMTPPVMNGLLALLAVVFALPHI